MALASLVDQMQYEADERPGRKSRRTGVSGKSIPHKREEVIIRTMPLKNRAHTSLDLAKIGLQARRPVVIADDRSSNLPTVSKWVISLLNGVTLLSLAIVVVSLFVFLAEFSRAETQALVPSFSAFLIFLVVGLVTFRATTKLNKFYS